MSPRKSTARDDDEQHRLRSAVEAERRLALASVDTSMEAFRYAKVGRAVVVRSPEGAPAFWLVPLEVGARACGFARVELSGRVSQLSSFGSSARDSLSWPHASFFQRPPPDVLKEVRALYKGASLGEPVLSYDMTPAKWAWRIVVRGEGETVIFVSPGGWYEKRSAGSHSGWEGQ